MNETKGTLKPTLSENVHGLIWKIVLNEKNYLLGAESRDAENKQVYFSVFNYSNGQKYFINKPLYERWNLNMVHLSESSLLIKVYPDEGKPVNKGIIALDCKTGDVKWEKHNIAFHNVWEEGLEVYNPDLLPKRLLLLEIETGDEIHNNDRSPLNSSIIFPDQHDQNIIPEWLIHSEIVGSVFYVKINERNFLSFHENYPNGLQLRLVVYEGVEILLDDILLEGIQKLQPETFFIVQNHLFCMKGNNKIISYLV
ncbi:MAG TPA: DUF4905 domain-containing protein [Sphingobacteriaceae bacterium]|nr:DUF4905 domain-containing protein [Sphingobacteriaceae bacterium]